LQSIRDASGLSAIDTDARRHEVDADGTTRFLRFLLAASAIFLGCGSGQAPRDAEDAGSPPVACSTRTVTASDGSCRCPASDSLCPTRGYAHFTISNVEGSGLPNEVSYEVTEELVTDTVTGLVWERSSPVERTTWADAKARCDALELGGRDDFRLPGRIELVTILDFEQLPVAASVFADAVSDYHFTSSPAAFVEGSAYSVYFGAGETAIASADPGRAVSRCVAGAVAATASQFGVEGEVVVDRVTGLRWERTAGEPAPFEAAATRCALLGMRLPSIRELQSIVDENAHDPAIDVASFPETPAAGFWSQTLRGSDPWHVQFLDGQTSAEIFPEQSLASRCVD
jgi:hypothetical protein